MNFSQLLRILLFLRCVVGQIRILQPPSLAQKFAQGYIKGSTAAFGTPYWGEQLIGKVEYGESAGGGHCSETDYELPPFDLPSDEVDVQNLARIVAVKRGICHFVTKVRIAQDYKNATAVIVIDEEPTGSSANDPRSVIMADDGWGRHVKIPSILINHKDGKSILEAILSGQDVIAELMWDVPNEKIVHVDAWITPAISSSINFLTHFSPYAQIFKHQLDFSPHFWIFSLPEDYNSLCLDSNGHYCAMAPDWGATNITGKDIVNESMRQACLWHTTASIPENDAGAGAYSEIWWKYIEQLNQRCLRPQPSTSANPLTADCSLKLMKDVGAPVDKVTDCVISTGNMYLSMDVSNHAWSPTAMMINDVRFSGPLDPFVVARAICTGYAQEPEVCEKLRSRHIQDYSSKNDSAGWILGETYAIGKGGVAWWIYFLSVLSCFIVASALILVYRNWLVQKLRNQLRYEVFEEVKSQIGGLREGEQRQAVAGSGRQNRPNHPSSVARNFEMLSVESIAAENCRNEIGACQSANDLKDEEKI